MTRPWAARAAELEPVQQHWADYAAWEEWLDREWERLLPDNDTFAGSLDCIEMVNLYSLMCDLADGAADVPLVVEDITNG